MRGSVDSLVTEKVLSLINSSDPPFDFPDNPLLKNVCAKVASSLSEEIDQICALLGISKRRFLESAFIDAVDSAHEIMRREDIFSAIQQQSNPEKIT